MAELVPVDHDPFGGAAMPPPEPGRVSPRVTVYMQQPEGKQPQLVPVDHDPFAKGGLDRIKGLGRALDAGVASGVAGLAALPGVVADAGAWAIDKAANAPAAAVDYLGGDGSNLRVERPQPTPGQFQLPTHASTMDAIQREFYGGEQPYQPQGKLEEYTKTVGEFAPGIIGPGGAIAKAAQVLVPAVTSETAGQLTKGSKAEPWARGITAVLTGGAASFLSRPGTAARALREQMPAGVTAQHVDGAAQLIEDAARQGIQLSWPEALSQVAGRPVLSNTMRHLEAAPQTEARMAEFFGQRPQQVDRAARQQFDNIAPVNNRPSTIGPQVGATADDALNAERQWINLATDADYAAASGVRLNPQQMAVVRALPGYDDAVAAIRNDPQLARYVRGMPEDSVGFLNEVKKQLDQQGANARAPMSQNPNMQRAAGFEMDAEAVRNAGTRASPDYALALEAQQRLRAQYLEPLLQGPLGKIANKDQTTKAAIDALFPSAPLANSAQEIGQTVRTLARRNERVARDLVRAHVEGSFNEASQALQSGANQMGGAKFRATLVGNQQQAANLEAAVRALPNGGQVWTGFNRLLDVLEATGTRQNIGSKTAYNADLLKSQAASGMVGEAVKGAANPIRAFQFIADKYERYRLGRNLNELADILTNPASANRLRAIAQMPANGSQLQPTVYRMLSAAQSSYSSGQQRR